MAERAIIFSAAMAQAILNGSKTQTRRVIRDEGKPCPYGTTGDMLWVREAHAWVDHWVDGFEREESVCVLYRADLEVRRWEMLGSVVVPEQQPEAWNGVKWRPSIHMPRWASRITLELTDVHAEQLQDISDEDALAEGVSGESPREAFADLWDSINAKRGFSWQSNPMVWVLTFRVAQS